MIIGKIHKGSGLGNQLHRYVMTRILALKKGYKFGFVGKENFKGASFLNLDWGEPVSLKYHTEEPSGKLVIDSPHLLWEESKYEYNPNIDDNFYNTVIDGEFQDERYFKNYLSEIKEWLKLDSQELADNLCIINFRGGEYVGVPDLFLPQEYWREAMRYMAEKYPGIWFKVVTDDIATAKKFFPMVPISHDIKDDWRSIRYAKYLILSNSSFAILPALLNQYAKEIIAPKFWGGRNIGEWRYPMNKYNRFTYL